MENSKFPKMKVFKSIQKNLAITGIGPKLVTQPYPLNGRILMGFLLLGFGNTFTCVFIGNYAKTFSEYTQSTYFLSAEILFIFALIIVILKVENLFEFINCCDCMLNISE